MPTEILIAALALASGLLAGSVLGYFWARTRGSREAEAIRAEQREAEAERDATREALTEARIELERSKADGAARERAVAEQKQLLADAQKKLEDAFGNLAGQALRQNNQAFLLQAEEKLKPIQQKIRELEEERKALEAKRDRDHGSLKEHLEKLSAAHESLGRHAHALETALRGSSQARGRWGEMALHNIVELAGMTEHCDFSEQTTVADGLRPDMVIRLPGGDGIPVDSKAPLSAYLDAQGAETPEERRGHLKQHAAQVRAHVRELAKREYSDKTRGKVSYTVLFLPGEPFLEAAFRENPHLQVEAMEKGVLIATPVTLMALLSTVGIYWQQQVMAERADEVWEASKELYGRIVTFAEHLGRAGSGLDRAVTHFNKAVGSFNDRVVPSGRRLSELKGGLDARKALDELDRVATQPRELPRKELGAGEDGSAATS